jgi:hypothetical protein
VELRGGEWFGPLVVRDHDLVERHNLSVCMTNRRYSRSEAY